MVLQHQHNLQVCPNADVVWSMLSLSCPEAQASANLVEDNVQGTLTIGKNARVGIVSHPAMS